MSGAPAAKKSLSAEPRASAAFQGIPCESCVYPGYSGVGGLLFHWQQKRRKRATKTPAASVYLLENLHFLQFFVADSVPGSIILSKGDRE